MFDLKASEEEAAELLHDYEADVQFNYTVVLFWK
jgi:hypothetical protein